MIPLKTLLDIVATEAVESIGESRINDSSYEREERDNFPPFDYRLELIQKKDGTYCWVED